MSFVSPELGERHGRVEAGEDGDGAELCRVPHELGLVVHSDNLAGVYLDKTAMLRAQHKECINQTSPELTSTSTNFQSKPESNSDKAASDTTWFLLPALMVSASTYLARAGELW